QHAHDLYAERQAVHRLHRGHAHASSRAGRARVGAITALPPSRLTRGTVLSSPRGRHRARPCTWREDTMTSRVAAAAAGALLIGLIGSPSSADVISDWGKSVIPPPPELKDVTVDASTTALLFLDIMKAGC